MYFIPTVNGWPVVRIRNRCIIGFSGLVKTVKCSAPSVAIALAEAVADKYDIPEPNIGYEEVE
jgi:hypothetical protein